MLVIAVILGALGGFILGSVIVYWLVVRFVNQGIARGLNW